MRDSQILKVRIYARSRARSPRPDLHLHVVSRASPHIKARQEERTYHDLSAIANPEGGDGEGASADVVKRAGDLLDACAPREHRLIDLLHLGRLIAILLDREAELDHAVDAARKGGRLVEREARGEQ